MSRFHRGIQRTRRPQMVVGKKTVWNHKLQEHYRKLRRPLRVRGLWRWRRIALHLHGAGLAVHSGTILTERQWQQFHSFLPDACKNMGEDTFELLAGLAFLRFPGGPKWLRKDTLLRTRAADAVSVLHAAAEGSTPPILQELRASFLGAHACFFVFCPLGFCLHMSLQQTLLMLDPL